MNEWEVFKIWKRLVWSNIPFVPIQSIFWSKIRVRLNLKEMFKKPKSTTSLIAQTPFSHKLTSHTLTHSLPHSFTYPFLTQCKNKSNFTASLPVSSRAVEGDGEDEVFYRGTKPRKRIWWHRSSWGATDNSSVQIHYSSSSNRRFWEERTYMVTTLWSILPIIGYKNIMKMVVLDQFSTCFLY